MRKFRDREEAGRLLARKLRVLWHGNIDKSKTVVLALPRGGVPVAYEIAKTLEVPFEVLVVRKIGAPLHPEFGIGAVAEEGFQSVDWNLVKRVGASAEQVEEILDLEKSEVVKRLKKYRGDRTLPSLEGKTVLLVDDGLATGVTARVAAEFAKKKGATRVVLAVPVCPPETAKKFRADIGEMICLAEPELFYSVGQFFEDFSQVSDDEVVALLDLKLGAA